MRRLLTIFLCVLATLVLAPSAARAAAVAVEVGPESGVQLGDPHEVTGRLTSDGVAPLAGQEVVLKVRPHPYRRGFRELARTTTGPDGRFAFEPELDRNHQVRVSAPAAGARSAVVRTFTFPRSRLSFRQLRPGVVRMTRSYTVPRAVRLRGTTHFYLGPSDARSARRRATAKVRRERAGRFAASVTLRIPSAYRGRFRFAGCLEVRRGAGMGDPRADCPRRFSFRRRGR